MHTEANTLPCLHNNPCWKNPQSKLLLISSAAPLLSHSSHHGFRRTLSAFASSLPSLSLSLSLPRSSSPPLFKENICYLGISFTGFGFNRHRHIFKVLEGEKGGCTETCNFNLHRPHPVICPLQTWSSSRLTTIHPARVLGVPSTLPVLPTQFPPPHTQLSLSHIQKQDPSSDIPNEDPPHSLCSTPTWLQCLEQVMFPRTSGPLHMLCPPPVTFFPLWVS